MDLRGLLPTSGTPLAHADSFTLPTSGLSAGTYTLSVQITDPAGISAPLQLASTGRQADGSYTLGSVNVQ